MLKATRYTVEPSKEFYSTRKIQLLIKFLFFNFNLSFIFILLLGVRIYFQEKMFGLINLDLFLSFISRFILAHFNLIELTIHFFFGLFCFFLAYFIQNGYRNARSVQTIIGILPVSLISGLAVYFYGNVAYLFIRATIYFKEEYTNITKKSDVLGLAESSLQTDFMNVSIMALFLSIFLGIVTVYNLIVFGVSLDAILESTKKLNDRLIFRDGEEEYILESGSKDFENDMGELYSNNDNSIWRFEAESRSSSTLEWMYFIDNVDYKKDVRILRKGSKILGLLYTKNSGLRLKVKVAYILREPETSLITQHILAQDYIRRRKLSRHPLKLVKISKKDKETQKILSDSGWTLKDSSEKNSLTVLYEEP